MHNGDGDGFQVIEERSLPDIYADSVRFEMNLYGVTLEFGQTQQGRSGAASPMPHVPKIRVHMSPQHAKIMAKLFVKNMRQYESQVGKLPLPQELYRDLGIDEEW
jgi:hypothetical protein